MDQISGCSVGGVWLFPLSDSISLWVCVCSLIIHDISTKYNPASAQFLPTKKPLASLFLSSQLLSHHLTSPAGFMFHLSCASLISSNIHSALRLLKCLQRIDHLTGIHNHQLLTDHSTTLCLYPKSLSYWFLSSVLLDFASSLLCFSCHAVISPPIYSLSWEILCYFLSLCFFPPKCILLWLEYMFPFQSELI